MTFSGNSRSPWAPWGRTVRGAAWPQVIDLYDRLARTGLDRVQGGWTLYRTPRCRRPGHVR